MERFRFEDTALAGLKSIQPFYAPDHRGGFLKSFERGAFESASIPLTLCEVFCTHSYKGVIRGLHFQSRNCQDKLVQVLSGAAYDVVVDLRKESPTFARWEGFLLTAENRRMLYIPKGFAHGFLALENDTLFNYLCGAPYDPSSDGGIHWDDPQLAIRWPLERVEHVMLSDKDAALPTLEEFLRLSGSHGLEVEEP